MSNYQNNQGNSPKKPKINEWVGTGIIRPRSNAENAVIEYKEFSNGKGVIHVNMKIEEDTGLTDSNGQRIIDRVTVPVDIFTNKDITAQTLRSIVPGTLVMVKGKLKLNSYQSSRTGQMVTALQVKAYVLEFPENPQAAYGQQMPHAPYQQPMPQYGQQMQPMPTYGQAMPQAAPQQMPQYQQAPAPAPAPAQAPVPPYYAPAGQPAPGQAPVPPYYAPAGQPAPGQAPYPPQAGGFPQGAYGQGAIVEDLP